MKITTGNTPRRIKGLLHGITGSLLLGASTLAPTLGYAKLPMNYALPEGYESQPTQVKRDILWDNITQYSYDVLPTTIETASVSKEALCPLDYGFYVFRGLFSPSWLAPRFTFISDEAPPEPDGKPHLKAIHTYGSAAKVRWVPSGDSRNRFSGIFQTGGMGILRASLAKPYAGEADSYRPGMGLKIFVDGNPSVNFHVMFSLDGQGGDKNFFSHDFKNIVPPAKGWDLWFLEKFPFTQTIRNYMSSGPVNPRTLPLDEAAHIGADGTSTVDPVTPYEITFVPTQFANHLIPSNDAEDDLRKQLAGIQIDANEPIYRILANTEGEKAIEVGLLYLESEFVASEYEDKILFFKHQRKIQSP